MIPGLSRYIRRVTGRWFVPNVQFAVLGNRACGKTTLINRMLGRPLRGRKQAPTVGESRIRKFDYVSVGQTVRVETSDISGDPTAWQLWDDAFVRDRPQGIIFMIDHVAPNVHKEAFRFLVDFIRVEDRQWLFFKGRHTKAREQLRIVMFLVNKADIWMRMQGYDLDLFLEYFVEEFDDLEGFGIPIVIHTCSALYGTDVDSALGDFFRRMLG